jgi:hypothetical protein
MRRSQTAGGSKPVRLFNLYVVEKPLGRTALKPDPVNPSFAATDPIERLATNNLQLF